MVDWTLRRLLSRFVLGFLLIAGVLSSWIAAWVVLPVAADKGYINVTTIPKLEGTIFAPLRLITYHGWPGARPLNNLWWRVNGHLYPDHPKNPRTAESAPQHIGRSLAVTDARQPKPVDYTTAIILGVIQGIAEFLPISSDGHLVIAGRVLGIRDDNIGMNVALHIGTLASILVVYRRDIVPALKNPRLVAAVIAATVPLVFVGLFLKDAIGATFDSPLIAGFGLLLTALVVGLMPRVERGSTMLPDVTWQHGLIVGLFQTIAVLPGVSRSGMTIFGGLTTGLQRQAAANFSFYIAVPAIAGAAVLHGKDLLESGGGGLTVGPTLVGVLTSFVAGVIALRLLLGLVSRGKLHWFAWYCAALGTGVIIWQLTSGA